MDTNRQKDNVIEEHVMETITVNKEIVSEKIFSIGDDQNDKSSTNETHQLFTEMDQLQFNEKEQVAEWKESARWVKFEEDVELGGRWSKPHVATLSLHSIFELRNCLCNGGVFLDVATEDLNQITDIIIDYFIETNQLDENNRHLIKHILLAKHLHQHEKQFQKNIDNGDKRQFPLIKSIADMGRKASQRDLEGNASTSPTNMVTSSNFLSVVNASGTSLKESNNTPVIFEVGSNDNPNTNKCNTSGANLVCSRNTKSNENNFRRKYKANQNFMRKIPQNAEASNVLIGEVDFLDKQLNAFVRLSKSLVLGDLTEVPVPTRFIFVLLGPSGNLARYREIGRSIATLMSDDIFHDVAYKAKDRQDLLAGVDDFLDQVTVLPPGEWHPNIQLDPPVKTLQKEERLELKAEIAKNNGQHPNGKKQTPEIEVDDELSNNPALEYTGRFCGGLIADIKRKAPFYFSDFRDGLNFKCLSTTLFLYFACLSPIITFGGLLGVATDKNMAAIESLVSGAVCGIMYHLFAGQPMTIIGSTGPVLVFETIVKKFCDDYEIDYLGFRFLIGFWIMTFLLIMVATDLSFLVKYITRFTEECFAILIAFIFLRESLSKLFDINRQYRFTNERGLYYYIVHNDPCYECIRKVNYVEGTTELPLDDIFSTEFSNSSLELISNFTRNNITGFKNFSREACLELGGDFDYINKCKYVPDVFLFSTSLYMFTFMCAMGLKFFRFTRFLPFPIRSKISDFGVVITVALSVSIDFFVGLDTPKLEVPSQFHPTRSDRGWLVNPISRNPDKIYWLIPAAIIPALLGTILIFMDQQITSVIMNRKEFKLRKGCGYHLDLLIISLCIGINSLLGIPWFVAATVLSMNHVLSLKVESQSAAPGEKPKFLGIIEQRVTGLFVFLLIGASVFLTRYLKFIPMPVLYAIFLYMGINPLKEIQFMHRLLLIFMPEKYQPSYNFLKHVRTYKVHLFTFIQLLSLIFLFVIKMNKTISIMFPLMVLALVFIRKLLDYLFTQKELFYLDAILPPFGKSKKTDNHVESHDEVSQSTNKRSGVDLDKMNISNELLKTSIWKGIADSNKQINESDIDKKKTVRSNRKIVSDINEDLDIPLIDQTTSPYNESLKKNTKS